MIGMLRQTVAKGGSPALEPGARRAAWLARAVGIGILSASLSGCVATEQARSAGSRLAGTYEVENAIYRVELLEGQPFHEQARDGSGRIVMKGGVAVEKPIFVTDENAKPKLVVSRADGEAMTVNDEAIALRAATMFCGENQLEPALSGSYERGRVVPATPSSVWEAGKWGIFYLCQ